VGKGKFENSRKQKKANNSATTALSLFSEVFLRWAHTATTETTHSNSTSKENNNNNRVMATHKQTEERERDGLLTLLRSALSKDARQPLHKRRRRAHSAAAATSERTRRERTDTHALSSSTESNTERDRATQARE
jgi:hypothetical protein